MTLEDRAKEALREAIKECDLSYVSAYKKGVEDAFNMALEDCAHLCSDDVVKALKEKMYKYIEAGKAK